MTNDQVRSVVAKYRERLDGLGFKPKNCPNGVGAYYRLCHICWMCAEIENMLEQETDTGKIHRWLGFVQGVLCADGMYSIDEMREHNRAEGAKT